MKLSYAGMMRIGGLVLDGVEQPVGTYGSPASNAPHKDARFVGTGLLRVGPMGLVIIAR